MCKRKFAKVRPGIVFAMSEPSIHHRAKSESATQYRNTASEKDWGMSEIANLEARITAALDRISAGVAVLMQTNNAGLEEELAAEREANAQLEERVRAIKDKQETMVAALQEEVAQLRQSVKDAEAERQRLKSVNAGLRSSNMELRKANASGLADPGLVNEAMVAEIEALRAIEEGTRGEIDRALGLLEPIMKDSVRA